MFSFLYIFTQSSHFFKAAMSSVTLNLEDHGEILRKVIEIGYLEGEVEAKQFDLSLVIDIFGAICKHHHGPVGPLI